MTQIGTLTLHRVLSMPAQPRGCALYFVKGDGVAETWLTDKDGVPWPVGNTELISQIIESYGMGDGGPIDPGDLTLAFENALI